MNKNEGGFSKLIIIVAVLLLAGVAVFAMWPRQNRMIACIEGNDNANLSPEIFLNAYIDCTLEVYDDEEYTDVENAEIIFEALEDTGLLPIIIDFFEIDTRAYSNHTSNFVEMRDILQARIPDLYFDHNLEFSDISKRDNTYFLTVDFDIPDAYFGFKAQLVLESFEGYMIFKDFHLLERKDPNIFQ